MIDGGSLLPGWERGPPAQPAPASRTSYGSPQRQQDGHGAKAAQEENTPERTASGSGSLPGPAASPSHLAQDSHGTAGATSSPVPAAPAQPAAPRLVREAGSRAPAASPAPGAAMCVPQGRWLSRSRVMAEQAQPCWPPPGPQPLLKHPQRGGTWGPRAVAGGPGGAAGQAGRAWQRPLAGLPVGPGAGGAQPAPGIAPGGCQACGREGGGGGNTILPSGTWALLPGQTSAANFSPGEAPQEHQLSPTPLRGGAGSCRPVLAGGGHGSRGTAQPWASPQASPPQLLAEPLPSRQPGADAALLLPTRLRPWLGQTHMWP